MGNNGVIAICINDHQCCPWYEIHLARSFTGSNGMEFGLTRFFNVVFQIPESATNVAERIAVDMNQGSSANKPWLSARF
jgi:hypothetical protein